MHPDDIKRLFPNASASTIARNAGFEPRAVVSRPERKQDPVDEPVAADAGKTFSQGRTLVLITSYRCKLLDDDNLALGSKPLVDGLVEAGFFPSDSKIWCEIRHRQVKIDCPKRERTEIDLWPIADAPGKTPAPSASST